MASSYTSRNRYEKQNPGENTNTWGSLLNTNTIDLIDESWGVVSVNAAGATAITLTANNGATDQGRRAVIVITGTPTSANSIIVPAVSKPYIVRAKHGGALAVKVKVAGGTGPTFLTGESGIVYADGTNVKEIVRNTSVASGFTAGMVMMWAGSVGGIPSGWGLCDGTGGTVNLSERFILSTVCNAGLGGTGGADSYNTTSAGSFTPVGTITALVTANIPAHSHYAYVSGAANDTAIQTVSNSFIGFRGEAGTADDAYIMCAASASQGVPNIGQIGWAFTSSPTAPTFTGTAGGEHRHSTSVVPKFYRLAFIQKL